MADQQRRAYGDPTRYVSSLTVRFFSEFITTVVSLKGFTLDEIAIISLVATESTRPMVDELGLYRDFAFEDMALPDEQRPAVKLKFIYTSLGINRETARRKLNKLVERGLIVKREDGYIFPEQVGAQDYTSDVRRVQARKFMELSRHLMKIGALNPDAAD